MLAGPGAGKTRVLTTRIARILDESSDKNFRLLALTFTTKAAKEMADRIEQLVPGLAARTFVGTFHAFCAQMLSLHGSHVGIKPDFGIYDQDDDRAELLAEVLATDPTLDGLAAQAVLLDVVALFGCVVRADIETENDSVRDARTLRALDFQLHAIGPRRYTKWWKPV